MRKQKRKNSIRATARKPTARIANNIRRTIVSMFVAAIGAIQVSSCGAHSSLVVAHRGTSPA